MNKSLLLLAAALLVIGAGSMVGAGTQAAFTDVTTASATFATGTINISLSNTNGGVNGDCDNAGTYTDTLATALFSPTTAIPGTITTGYVCIKNDSTTLATQYSLSSTVTDDTTGGTLLKGVTKIRIHRLNDADSIGDVACVASMDNTGTNVVLQTNATQLYANTLLSTNPSFAASGTTGIATAGFQKVCVTVVLPLATSDSDPAAGTTIQGKTITASFTITGNQV